MSKILSYITSFEDNIRGVLKHEDSRPYIGLSSGNRPALVAPRQDIVATHCGYYGYPLWLLWALAHWPLQVVGKVHYKRWEGGVPAYCVKSQGEWESVWSSGCCQNTLHPALASLPKESSLYMLPLMSMQDPQVAVFKYTSNYLFWMLGWRNYANYLNIKTYYYIIFLTALAWRHQPLVPGQCPG